MIIGNGLIAKSIAPCDRDDVLFFASGVSNSVNPTYQDFLREQNLLIQAIENLLPNHLLVYFSTVSIADASVQHKAYIKHKINMEALVKAKAEKHLIVRLPNMLSVLGNHNTLIPYFYNAILNGNEVQIQSKATRYLLTPMQLESMIAQLLDDKIYNKTINGVLKEPLLVLDIYLAMVNLLEGKPCFKLKQGGEHYVVSEDYVFRILPNEGIADLVKGAIV